MPSPTLSGTSFRVTDTLAPQTPPPETTPSATGGTTTEALPNAPPTRWKSRPSVASRADPAFAEIYPWLGVRLGATGSLK